MRTHLLRMKWGYGLEVWKETEAGSVESRRSWKWQRHSTKRLLASVFVMNPHHMNHGVISLLNLVSNSRRYSNQLCLRYPWCRYKRFLSDQQCIRHRWWCVSSVSDTADDVSAVYQTPWWCVSRISDTADDVSAVCQTPLMMCQQCVRQRWFSLSIVGDNARTVRDK